MPKKAKLTPVEVLEKIPVIGTVVKNIEHLLVNMPKGGPKQAKKLKKTMNKAMQIYERTGPVRPKRRKGRGTVRKGGFNSIPTKASNGLIKQVSAPTSSSAMVSQNAFTVGVGKPSRADVDDHNSIRVQGHSMLSCLVKTNTTNAGVIPLSGEASEYLVRLIPNNLDPRLATFCTIYTKYCIRRLILTYVPLCPTSTSAGPGLGLLEDDSTVQGWNTSSLLSKLMSQRVAQMCPAWNPMVLQYENDGMKSYHTSNAGGEPYDDLVQLTLGGISTTEAKDSAATSWGRLECCYTIDLYLPKQPQAVYTTDVKFARPNEKDVKTVKADKESVGEISLSSSAVAVAALPRIVARDDFYVVTPGAIRGDANEQRTRVTR